MPRRSLLTPAERASLLAFPTTDDELICHYTFSERGNSPASYPGDRPDLPLHLFRAGV